MIDETIYDNQLTATKCYKCIHFPLCMAQKGGVNLGLASENDCMYFQPKMPDDVVVLTKEELNENYMLIDTHIFVKETLEFEKRLLQKEIKQVRKETAREIFYKIKETLIINNEENTEFLIIIIHLKQ